MAISKTIAAFVLGAGMTLASVVTIEATTAVAQIHQPEMQAALDSLISARDSLTRAKANKGGHRVKAIGLVNDAIAEVKRGIEVAE
jgi:hypothetical protein